MGDAERRDALISPQPRIGCMELFGGCYMKHGLIRRTEWACTKKTDTRVNMNVRQRHLRTYIRQILRGVTHDSVLHEVP